MNFIFYIESYDVHEFVKVYICSDNSWYLAFCKIWVCQQLTTSLFSWKLLFIDVFVQSSLCSFSFPYMEISNPVYIIAGIHQGMQFARLLGSVLWRRTACNCLSHHLQKKKNFWKAIASVTTLMLTKRKEELGDGKEAFYLCYLYCSLLMPMKHTNFFNV